MSEEGCLAASPARSKLREFFREEIATVNVDFLLLLISLGVGCIDGFTFTELKVFSANQ